MEMFWLVLGFSAQAVFGGRFVVQWIASERAGRSVVPVSFWFLSLAGGLLLMVYALYRRDPVFISGQIAATLIYLRNLYLIYRERRQKGSVAHSNDSFNSATTKAAVKIEAAPDSVAGRR